MFRLLIICCLFVNSCAGNNNEQANTLSKSKNTQEEFSSIQPDPTLDGIQDKIKQAFVQSILLHKDDEMMKLNKKLEELYKAKGQKLILYWQAYLEYYSAIFYFQEKNKKSSENEIDKGIDLIKNIKTKDSEDYALLAMLQSFSIQFKGMSAMLIAEEVNKNIKNAFTLDSTNVRAYYVFANNSFYTPQKYGGGKQVEKYLLKAISLPAQKLKSGYLPSWGKEESYEMLIKSYIQKEKWDLAKKYYKQGIEEFPQSYLIIQLASQLVGK